VEIKIEIERRGPDSESKMRYFKIPLCRIFRWKSEIDQIKLRTNVGPNDMCQWQLGSKIGVWHIRYHNCTTKKEEWLNVFICAIIYDKSQEEKRKKLNHDLSCNVCHSSLYFELMTFDDLTRISYNIVISKYSWIQNKQL